MCVSTLTDNMRAPVNHARISPAGFQVIYMCNVGRDQFVRLCSYFMMETSYNLPWPRP